MAISARRHFIGSYREIRSRLFWRGAGIANFKRRHTFILPFIEGAGKSSCIDLLAAYRSTAIPLCIVAVGSIAAVLTFMVCLFCPLWVIFDPASTGSMSGHVRFAPKATKLPRRRGKTLRSIKRHRTLSQSREIANSLLPIFRRRPCYQARSALFRRASPGHALRS